jgi:hypothetical protein
MVFVKLMKDFLGFNELLSIMSLVCHKILDVSYFPDVLPYSVIIHIYMLNFVEFTRT